MPYIWYALTPNRWIRCQEIRSTIGGITATLYDGNEINGLHKRQIVGATIVQ